MNKTRSIWEYEDATGVTRRGVFHNFTDYGGTDVSYHFHRLDDDGNIIKFENGGRRLDIVTGERLKQARIVGQLA